MVESQLGVERRQLFLDHLDQVTHALAVEDEARPGGRVELRQWPAGAQRERLSILAHRLAAIGQAVAPDLQRTELRDSVLDVVEGKFEEVRLVIPAGDPLSVEPAPVDRVAFKTATQLQPLAIARVRITSFRRRVHPLLERVHGCAVREKDDRTFGEAASGADRLRVGGEPTRLTTEGRHSDTLRR